MIVSHWTWCNSLGDVLDDILKITPLLGEWFATQGRAFFGCEGDRNGSLAKSGKMFNHKINSTISSTTESVEVIYHWRKSLMCESFM
jgi:hypothetical protein